MERWYQEVWVAGRATTIIDELMTPECRIHVEGVPGEIDRTAFKAYRAQVLMAIPDLRMEKTILAIENGTVVISWRALGTHTGEGLGIPPSNGKVDFSGLSRFHFRNGLIVGGADAWNRGEVIASLMQVRTRERCTSARLSPREAQVALLMAERFTHQEIALQLRISPNTARRHCEQVLRKLGLHSRHDVGEALGKVPGAGIFEHRLPIKAQQR